MPTSKRKLIILPTCVYIAYWVDVLRRKVECDPDVGLNVLNDLHDAQCFDDDSLYLFGFLKGSAACQQLVAHNRLSDAL